MEFVCAMQCNRQDFCDAWCIVESECYMTNFYISPQDGPDDSSHIQCYTNRRTGNHILKATATGSKTRNNRFPSLLTKGIQNYNFKTTTSHIDKGLNPFMLFEFPSEILVRTINILIEDGKAGASSDKTEVRLGSTMPGPTDFSQLDSVGTLPDPPTKFYEMRTITVDPPKTARFLAILETDGSRLTICFLEVFS